MLFVFFPIHISVYIYIIQFFTINLRPYNTLVWASDGLEVKHADPEMGSQIRACLDPLKKTISTQSTVTLNLWVRKL